jgi:trehalose 6-phosphate phosphatase
MTDSQSLPPGPLPPDEHALFLDVDGTLLELAAHPNAVHVPKPLIRLLERLRKRFGGAVAVISGRPLHDIDALFSPLTLPAAGVHGIERRDAEGTPRHRPSPASWRSALQAELLAFARAHPKVLLEDKGHAMALHYRRAPELADDVERLAETLVTRSHSGVRLLRGKMVREFLPIGTDKGIAVRDFLAETPFSGRRPVYVGDDVTDEAGFSAVNALGGVSVRVGPPADTHAQYRLADVPGVYAWLTELAPQEDQPRS